MAQILKCTFKLVYCVDEWWKMKILCCRAKFRQFRVDDCSCCGRLFYRALEGHPNSGDVSSFVFERTCVLMTVWYLRKNALELLNAVIVCDM